VVGLQLDVLHVRRAGADVLRRDVAAAQGIDEPPVGPEQRLAIGAAVVPDDDALAPTQIDPRHRRLVGHAASQPQRVGDRIVGAVVPPEPGAAERRAQRRVVDGYDTEIAAGGIMGEEHLFVTHRMHLGEQVVLHRIRVRGVNGKR
jgi:hypothetical protein